MPSIAQMMNLDSVSPTAVAKKKRDYVDFAEYEVGSAG